MKALLLLPILAACATMPPPASAGALNQPQRVGRFTVTPLAVVEDSRCPMNARCVWAGRAIVRATVRDGRSRLTRNFTLGEPMEGVVLDSVMPERMAGARPATPPAVRVHFSLAPVSS